MRILAIRILASLCLVLAMAAAQANGAQGLLGFSVTINGTGFFLNPTLKSATIISVSKGSPAANAGITAGDLIIEAEGHVIAGSKGRELKQLMEVAVGQSLHLKLKRPNGEEYSAVLVAVPRPPKP